MQLLFLIFDKMTAVDHISAHFRSIRNFIILEMLYKMAAVGHFGCPEFTFDRISGHFRSIRNFNCLERLSKCKHSYQYPPSTKLVVGVCVWRWRY